MDEVLRRIDEHMARGNEHMARGNEYMARGNELMEEVREEFRLNREEHRKNREAFELYKLAMAQMLDDNKSFMRGVMDELRELRKDSRAHSEAIFRMIERLDRFDGGPATA
jgi:hypothetical protein